MSCSIICRGVQSCISSMVRICWPSIAAASVLSKNIFSSCVLLLVFVVSSNRSVFLSAISIIPDRSGCS